MPLSPSDSAALDAAFSAENGRAELPRSLVSRGLQDLGDCRALLPQLADALRQESSLLQDFQMDELATLGGAMHLVQAASGQVLIQEGDSGDWMLLLLSGTVDVTKQVMRHDATGQPTSETLEMSRLAVVRAGASLGEMSMFDGEPRNASCSAIDEVQVGILTRSAISALIREHPAVGAKLLVKITQLLAQRLRNTSAKLVKSVVDQKQRTLFKP